MTGCHHPPIRPPDLVDMDPLLLKAYDEWGQTMHLQRQLALRFLPDTGMHPGQAKCLWAISTNDGITQRDLADLLHVSRPTVTAMLHRLERSGYIERSNDEDDARLTRIFLTDAGRELDERLRAFHRKYIDATIGSFSKPDRAEFVRLLGVLRDNIEHQLHDQEEPTG